MEEVTLNFRHGVIERVKGIDLDLAGSASTTWTANIAAAWRAVEESGKGSVVVIQSDDPKMAFLRADRYEYKPFSIAVQISGLVRTPTISMGRRLMSYSRTETFHNNQPSEV